MCTVYVMETEKTRARELYALWRKAYDAAQRSDSDRASWIEQRAWDDLVDYVDAHGLTYSELDPRGPSDGA